MVIECRWFNPLLLTYYCSSNSYNLIQCPLEPLALLECLIDTTSFLLVIITANLVVILPNQAKISFKSQLTSSVGVAHILYTASSIITWSKSRRPQIRTISRVRFKLEAHGWLAGA